MTDFFRFGIGSAFHKLELDLVSRIQVAATDGVSGALNGVAALAAAFGSKLGNRADMVAVHQQVAAEMRTAVMTAYEESVELGRKDYGVRSGSPARLSGMLRKALDDEDLVVGTARGINFVDTDRLYQQAKHFARLNFGTQGPGARGTPARQVPISLFGAVLFSVGLNWGPSPAFYLPKGLFLGGGHWYNPSGERRGQDVFYPMGELPSSFLAARAKKQPGYDADHPVKAIEARRFLDAGLVAMAEELPAAYNRLVQSWFERGGKGGGVFLEHLQLRGGRVPQVRVTP